MFFIYIENLVSEGSCFLLLGEISSVADPHRKKADADPGKNLNADAGLDSCPYCTMASKVIV
jgi:hypothetical protein